MLAFIMHYFTVSQNLVMAHPQTISKSPRGQNSFPNDTKLCFLTCKYANAQTLVQDFFLTLSFPFGVYSGVF